MKAIGVLLLVLLLTKSILLYKTAKAMPLTELRRQARAAHAKHSQALYKLLAFETSLKILIWLAGVTSGTVLLLMIAQISGWLALASIALVSWLLLSDKFYIRPGSWLWQTASYIAPLLLPIVDLLQPLFGRVAEPGQRAHSKVYEKDDLLQLLKQQAKQVDNRLDEAQLKAAHSALTFPDKQVSDIMIPRKKIRWVEAKEPIGPMLMDELHSTGFSLFPVVKEGTKTANPEVIGALHLPDLLKNLEQPGSVRDIMQSGAHYINESHSLHQALDAFLKTKSQLLIVVNNFEETLGIITLDDVLHQALGHKINGDFSDYHDKRAVAGHEG